MAHMGAGHLLALAVAAGEHAGAAKNFRDDEARLLEDPWALCAAGQAFEALHDTESALRVWRRGAYLDPENPWPREQVARLPARHEAAGRTFSRAQRLLAAERIGRAARRRRARRAGIASSRSTS